MRARARLLCWLLGLIFIAAACSRRAAVQTTLTVVGFGLDAGERLRREVLDDFTARTGIRVDLIPAWGSSAEQLSEAVRLLNRRNPPDVFVLDVVWPGTLGANLLDLRTYDDGSTSRHQRALLTNNMVDGRLVALPLYVNVGVLYYRTDLLKAYGYDDPPATWDELETMAARIQQGERKKGNPDFSGFVWQGAAYEGLTCDALEWLGAYGGGRILEPDHTVSINNSQAVRALERARSWVGQISPKGVLSYTESDSLAVFRAGNAAFLRHWSGALSPNRSGETPIRGRFDATLLPAGPHGRAQAMGGFHLAVSRASAHPSDAAKLVFHLSGNEVQLRRALSGGYLPTRPALYDNSELLQVLPIAAKLRNAGEESWVVRPSTVAGNQYRAVSEAYYRAVHQILSRAESATKALADLETELVRVTGFRPGSPVK